MISEEWRADWLPDFQRLESILRDQAEAPHSLCTVLATTLLKLMDSLEKSEDRPNIARWKGKLLPEGYVSNTVMDFEEDDEMVTVFSNTEVVP